jgi:hypothetical protein
MRTRPYPSVTIRFVVRLVSTSRGASSALRHHVRWHAASGGRCGSPCRCAGSTSRPWSGACAGSTSRGGSARSWSPPTRAPRRRRGPPWRPCCRRPRCWSRPGSMPDLAGPDPHPPPTVPRQLGRLRGGPARTRRPGRASSASAGDLRRPARSGGQDLRAHARRARRRPGARARPRRGHWLSALAAVCPTCPKKR